MATAKSKESVGLNLWQKIAKVMEDVEYLQKDDNIRYGKTNYNAMSEEKVTSTFRKSLIKYGLVIFPVEQEVDCREIRKRNENGEEALVGFLTSTNTKYKLVDIDTGDFEIIASSGQGVDTQDKGVGKAMTYSFKYAFVRTFATPTGDDPDKISSEELTDAQLKELGEQSKETKKPVKIDTPDEAGKLIKEKFPGAKKVSAAKEAVNLADDPDIIAMKKKVVEAGTSARVADALIRSYTPENKDTLLRILESKL
jgi:hypothetical protein